ncbi:MAG: galactose mutarotase [Oscillospiraceae bacterium]|jgi:aldose 1-epimerase|nr:galactose mutarotase [Oscillospiraceae bacterium]
MVRKIDGVTVLRDGRTVDQYIIENKNHARVELLTLGATIRSLFIPGKNGDLLDVALGFDNIEDYLTSDYQGATVGPYANRICKGEFTVSGKHYAITKNEDGINSLHSARAFTNAVWSAEILLENAVKFNCLTKKGTEGFPGDIRSSVTYTLSDINELHMEFAGTTDEAVPFNPTNHNYFNLSGYDAGSILDTVLTIYASHYTPVDAQKIPTGEIADVKDTPFTFLRPAAIGERINFDCEQLKNTGGYDHNFCIDGADGTLHTAAVACDPKSGITLTVKTTLPGIQFYTGNFLNGQIGKNRRPMELRTGFCLETQFYPDTPNHPNFPQCTLLPGKEYCSTTVYAFSVK